MSSDGFPPAGPRPLSEQNDQQNDDQKRPYADVHPVLLSGTPWTHHVYPTRRGENGTRAPGSPPVAWTAASEIALVEEHPRAVGLALAVGEAGALVEPYGRCVVHARAKVDPHRARLARRIHRALEQGAADPVAP